jgi:hypothetical protein
MSSRARSFSTRGACAVVFVGLDLEEAAPFERLQIQR